MCIWKLATLISMLRYKTMRANKIDKLLDWIIQIGNGISVKHKEEKKRVILPKFQIAKRIFLFTYLIIFNAYRLFIPRLLVEHHQMMNESMDGRAYIVSCHDGAIALNDLSNQHTTDEKSYANGKYFTICNFVFCFWLFFHPNYYFVPTLFIQIDFSILIDDRWTHFDERILKKIRITIYALKRPCKMYSSWPSVVWAFAGDVKKGQRDRRWRLTYEKTINITSFT